MRLARPLVCAAARCCAPRMPAARRFATAHATLEEAAAAAAAAQRRARAPPSQDSHVRIVEVGPRDGLQNEQTAIGLDTKLELIARLAATGLQTIEAGSFVAPKWVPQMASSDAILERVLDATPPSPAPVSYAFLVPNARGLADAAAILGRHAGAFVADTQTSDGKPGIELAVFAAATETFSQKNLNCDVATSLARFADVIAQAKQLKQLKPTGDVPVPVRVRAYISVVLGCPFEGRDVDPARVAHMATDLLEMGADEIALGDTTGMGTAPRTHALLRAVTAAGVRTEDLALHFHDTYGQALVNTAVGLEHGVRVFDSSVGGLGGCPYSPGATGNVATEDMVYFLESLGMATGVDLDAVAATGAWITETIGKPNASSVGRALLGRKAGR